MVVVAVELSRLLRRALLVAAVAAAGWLLSAVFASAASAEELPGDNAQPEQSGGLLGNLIGGLTGGLTDVVGGVTDRLTDVTGSLVDTAGDALLPIVDEPQAPVTEPPAVLPGSSSGSAATDRNDAVPHAETVVAPVVPAAPVVAPAPVPPPSEAPAPVKPPVATVPAAPAAPPATTDVDSAATEHADGGEPEPQPTKAPSAPASSGTTVSTAHDNAGGARGTHGVLPAQATLHAADAGFTTRSLAVNGAGRAAGLPASSPD